MFRKICSALVLFVCYVSHGLDITGKGQRQGRSVLSDRKHFSETWEKAGPNLLRPEETQNAFNHSFPGCWLGGQFYMVGDRWSPSIEPLGVVYCVKCQCAQVIRKGVIQLDGKVVCRNIKPDCPSVKCKYPVIRPKTCCRVCPGQEPYFEDQFGQEQTNITETKTTIGGYNTGDSLEMTALLTGDERGRRKHVKTRAVAAIHVTNIRNNSFNYVIRYSRLKSPVFLRFTDDYGGVLLEKQIPQQTSRSGRFTGTWSDVSLSYMQYIVQELTIVTIATSRHSAGEISGRLRANSVATTATFEAVLTPPTPRGFGAFAQMIIDDVTSIGTYVIQLGGLHYFNNDKSEFFVTFEKDTEIMQQLLLRISDAKLVGKITFDKQTSKQIARGRLRIRVTSRSGDTMIGLLRPRMQRMDMIAVFNQDINYFSVSGVVALALEENGNIRYKVVVDGIDVSRGITVSLQRNSSTRDRWKTFATLPKTPEIHTPRQINMAGFYKKVRALDTSSILENNIKLKVTTGHNDDGITSMFQPIQAKTIDIFTASHAVLRAENCPEIAVVLYHMTQYCTFAYHVIFSNMTSLSPTTPVLRLVDRYSSSGDRTSDLPEGSINNIPDRIFRSLRRGDGKLTLRTSHGQCNQLTSQSLTVPNSCHELTGSGPETNEAEKTGGEIYRCVYADRFYVHGETWVPADRNGCATCRCDKGDVFCNTVPCPPTPCTYPRTREGECCPVCEEDNETERKFRGNCFYHGDKRWHPVGSTWYPYVPPFGYSKCALCYCEVDTLQVNCSRLPCPELNCPPYQRIRINKDDCCQVCREGTARVIKPDLSRQRDCKFGSNVYKHGQKWHPWLTPFGEMKCYVCSCKKGKSRCRKLQCEKLMCENQHHPAGRCCPVCREPEETDGRDIPRDRTFLRPRLTR